MRDSRVGAAEAMAVRVAMAMLNVFMMVVVVDEVYCFKRAEKRVQCV